MKIKRTERGWAGHFILADECSFRRNTLLQYGSKYIVISTVGGCRPRQGENVGEMRDIGVDRYYETMAFRSDASDKIYHDANVSEDVYASNSKWAINKKELDENGSEIDNIANKMHENYVDAIEKMLIDGSL